MTTTYERRGDHFVLNGCKYLISNGGIADAVITFAYPRGGEGGKVPGSRISAFIVERGPGFASEDLVAKMGMPTSNTAMFELSNCPVPVGNLLGEEGTGFRIAMGTLVSGRISVAAGCLGVIEDCLAECVSYAKERHQHGKPIGKHQLVQEHLAVIEQARFSSDCVLFRAAEAKDASNAEPGNSELRSRAELLAAQAKLFISNAAWQAADHAVQLFGGRGWSTLYRVGRHLMDVRVCRIYEGTDEILKMKVAVALLGKDFEAYK
jgi:alkylation response protein AidB-like acyl-CoA dehydrogenase